MLLFFISLLALAVSIFLTIKFFKKSEIVSICSMFGCVIFLGLTLGLGIHYFQSKKENAELLTTYNDVITTLNTCEDVNTLNALYIGATEIDEVITTHKNKVGNVWTGKLFSEDVASLDLLQPQIMDKLNKVRYK